MPRVPKSVSEMIAFCNEHATTWTGLTGIGILPADVTKLKSDLSAAQVAVAAQLAAKQAALNATINAKLAVSTLRKTISSLVRTIVAFAEAQAKPDTIFALAGLAPDAPRSPAAPPGQPTDLSATLDANGNLTLKWKCANPPGSTVIYSVTRAETTAGPFVQVGLVGGKRSFKDTSIPEGSGNGVTYQIQGVRGDVSGPSSFKFTLQFGNAGGGFSVSTETVPLRVAA